jgi:hypothetical protein
MVRVRRGVVPILVLASVLAVSASAQRQSQRPPSELHRVGDHWTAYYPPDPATFPPGSKVHTIVRGDTLWDLAQQFYGNAYLWPQLWETNTYIRDAHWIYPGDPLLVQGEAGAVGVPTTTTVEEGTGFGQEGEVPMATTSTLGSPIPLATEADLYCWGYIGALEEPMPNFISSFEDSDLKWVKDAVRQDIGVATGEIIFVTGGTSTGLIAGETYLVVRPSELVEHPVNGDVVGRHYDFRGQVRILCATEDHATAIVTQACNDLGIGDRLKPVPQLPIPLARVSPIRDVCSPISGKQAGHIVNAKDYRYALGIGALVQVDLGRDDAVQPGDFLTVTRDSPVPGNPPQILGEIGVLTTDSTTATGRIVQMRYSMQVGDRVELK